MSRLKNLDCLKALAMFAVLVVHVPDSATARSTAWGLFDQSCRFAVPCFFLVAGFFFARSHQKAADGHQVIVRYVSRLLPLFLFWGFFYAVAPPLRGDDPPYNSPFLSERLAYIFRHPKAFALTGDAVQLWFLSSLIQAICIVGLCLSARKPWLALALGTVGYGSVICSTYSWLMPVSEKFNAVFSAIYLSLCATFFVAFGAAAAVYEWRLGVGVAAVLALGGLLLHCTEAWSLQDPAHGILIKGHAFLLGTVPLAVGLFFLALALPDIGPRWLAWIGTYSLGIYVIHIYLMKLVGLLPAGRALASVPLLYVGVIYVISLLVSVALARGAYTRRLVS